MKNLLVKYIKPIKQKIDEININRSIVDKIDLFESYREQNVPRGSIIYVNLYNDITNLIEEHCTKYNITDNLTQEIPMLNVLKNYTYSHKERNIFISIISIIAIVFERNNIIHLFHHICMLF